MNISQILTKLKALIYSKSETDSLLGGKANSSHTHTKSQITDFPSLATVATSGSYTDLSNKPTIPSNTNQLTNGAGFITSSGSCNYANSAGSAKVADYAKLLAYSHTNEINFKGGRQATCYFNYRNADDDSIGTAATVEYKFCNYGGNSVSNVTVSAGTFKENGSSLADKYQAKGSYASSSHTHTKSQITDFPTIPSTTSQLTNDSGFLTSHQSLDSRVAIAGDTMTGTLNLKTENNVCLDLRPSHSEYHDTISVQTSGNEAVVFATKNTVTSWMFVNGEDSITNHTDSRWQSLTPGLQIKSNKVAIGKLIANGANLTYPLEVNGTVSASSMVVTNNSSNGVVFGSYRVYVG